MQIGFVSTRFAGTDGVSLETSKWAQVLEADGHRCYWFAGELDRDPSRCSLVPEAHFLHERNQWINTHLLGKRRRAPQISSAIHSMRSRLKLHLHQFISRFNIDILIPQNALSLPMQLPLGLALTEVIAETGIPAIAHHHDFAWERPRYAVFAAPDYLSMAFPPRLDNISHVVINSVAAQQLAHRTGIGAEVIPNVLDFNQPPKVNPDKVNRLRAMLALTESDTVVLQPTRVVQRKGIEHAIALVRALQRPNCKLVISHASGDEGHDYADWLRRHAQDQGVDLRFMAADLGDPWNPHPVSEPEFTLNDVYPLADVITFPSACEGFGNAFLEAIYHGKPLLVNHYEIFQTDIAPLGFHLASMDGYLTRDAVEQIQAMLDSPLLRQQMAAANYEVARQHFSYERLKSQLDRLMHAVHPPHVTHPQTGHSTPARDAKVFYLHESVQPAHLGTSNTRRATR
ncbi:MAG: glycosyltransferase family 4 protein [Desulfosarcinaceae bacterium]|nr:glycosyltransferase family 4 protein [Desulfosarcinaceae bacterium]